MHWAALEYYNKDAGERIGEYEATKAPGENTKGTVDTEDAAVQQEYGEFDCGDVDEVDDANGKH